MPKPTLASLERRIQQLEAAHVNREHERHTYAMAHAIAKALLAKGDKFDLRLVAKFQALLGIKLVDIAATAPNAVRKGLKVKGEKRTRGKK